MARTSQISTANRLRIDARHRAALLVQAALLVVVADSMWTRGCAWLRIGRPGGV